jgi:DNA invertase Pin-like site-specific DNA recombinase
VQEVHHLAIKRVACLYRVSTENQLSDDDIPMQTKACAEFIKKQRTWKLEKEYIEKGVSGYHKSANERDALVKLKKDAAAGKFDVLLVFMFDRLGRREDETPFVVEWLVEQGIEVWSVMEGQQVFNDHADKLINYIRYWQSGGESEHTSMRVVEKHNQLVMAGKFRGGVAPFGYKLEYSGEYNRKGYERKKLVIHEPEAMIVRKIFELSSDLSMGSYRVAKIINDDGHQTREGKKWTVQYIVRMLRNPVYKGDYVTGKVRRKRGKPAQSKKETWVHSRELVLELMIVSEAVWEQVNANISQRDTKANAIPHDKSGFLLSDIACCGNCNAKMHPRISRSKRRLKRTGDVAVYNSKYYFCPKKARQGDCDGHIQYGIKKIEGVVLDEIYSYLDNLKAMNVARLAKTHKAQLEKVQSMKLKPIEQKITSLQKEIALLENEILKFLMGESVYTEERLSSIMKDKSISLSLLETERASSVIEAESAISRLEEIITLGNVVVSWKKEFASSDVERQAELIGMIIDRIHITREAVDISFKFNLHDIEDFSGSRIVRHGGAPPACPVGSACCGNFGFGGFEEFDGGRCESRCGRECRDGCGRGRFDGFGRGRWGMNWLGSVTEIPLEKIASFTHNAL